MPSCSPSRSALGRRVGDSSRCRRVAYRPARRARRHHPASTARGPPTRGARRRRGCAEPTSSSSRRSPHPEPARHRHLDSTPRRPTGREPAHRIGGGSGGSEHRGAPVGPVAAQRPRTALDRPRRARRASPPTRPTATSTPSSPCSRPPSASWSAAPLDPAGLFLDELVGRDVAEDTLAPRAMAEAVTVSTPSGVIGREFDVVVLAGVQENVWPDMRIRGSLLGAGQLIQALGERNRTMPTDERAAVLARRAAAVRPGGVAHAARAPRDRRTRRGSGAVRRSSPAPPPPTRPRPTGIRCPCAAWSGACAATLTTDRDPQRTRQAAIRPRPPGTRGGARRAPVAVVRARRRQHGSRHSTTADEAPVRVSPSRMEAFETCELHWLIDHVGGATRNTAASLGSIIHAVAEHAVDLDDDLADGSARVRSSERWGELAFESPGSRESSSGRAEELTQRLSAYLRDFRRAAVELLGAEGAFSLTVGDARAERNHRPGRAARGRGRYRRPQDRAASPPPTTPCADHAQLGAYQLAFADGAIDGTGRRGTGRSTSGDRVERHHKQDWRSPTQARLDAERARRVPRAGRARRRTDGRHDVHGERRGALPRPLLVRQLPHPRRRAGVSA